MRKFQIISEAFRRFKKLETSDRSRYAMSLLEFSSGHHFTICIAIALGTRVWNHLAVWWQRTTDKTTIVKRITQIRFIIFIHHASHISARTASSTAIMNRTFTEDEVLRIGLLYVGYNFGRQQRVERATNVGRFQSHYGSTWITTTTGAYYSMTSLLLQAALPMTG